MSTWERKLEAVNAVYKDKKYNRALFLLDETLKTHSDIPIYTTKCDILIELNRVEEAINVAKEMAVANEQSPEGYQKGAYICKSLKKYQPALGIVNLGIAAFQKEEQPFKQSSEWRKLHKIKEELQKFEKRRLSSRRDPMTVLPTDLVHEIVRLAINDLNNYFLDSDDNCYGYSLVLRLSYVNRLWRHTMFSLPELWRGCFVKFDGPRVDPAYPYKKIDAYYQRSNRMPLKDIAISLHKSYDYHYPQDYEGLYKYPMPWLSPETHMRSILIGFRCTYKGRPCEEPLSTIINTKMFSTVDKFVYMDRSTAMEYQCWRVFNQNSILKRVKKELYLRGVIFGKVDQVVSRLDFEEDPLDEISPLYQYPLQHLKLVLGLTPIVPYLMMLFPRLKTLEMSHCGGCLMWIDRRITDVSLPDLESLKLDMVRYNRYLSGLDMSDMPEISFCLPNLRHCELGDTDVFMLSCIQHSTKLKHLGVSKIRTDLISQDPYVSGPSSHIDKFVSALDNLRELEVLELDDVVFAPAVLETILKNKLCPKLRKVTVVKTTVAIDEYILRLIEQRNCTDDFASIDELCLRFCRDLQTETIEFVRQHVEVVDLGENLRSIV